jgi:hypothetical protein
MGEVGKLITHVALPAPCLHISPLKYVPVYKSPFLSWSLLAIGWDKKSGVKITTST